MTKALREAKVHTSWLSPNEEYETAVERFVRAILDRRRPNVFLQAFEPLQALVAQLGIYNSLAQLLIKVTAPGVPDFYQGSELWELNLVDPDNRRPVDYAMRRATLAGLSASTPTDLLEQRADGRVKMFVTNRALAARAELRDLYEQGDYVPLQTSGARRDSVFAFARTMPGSASMAITCVPRLVASLTPDGAPPIGCGVWADTRIDLPAALTAPARFRDVFTGATLDVEPAGGTAMIPMIPAAAVFERFPVALLVPCSI
jgi:(1->4)-alpha-D-glucan 1-alpha-D-glucosylmutase